MSLACKAAVVAFTVVSTVACHDPAAPPIPPMGYHLVNVNGRPLPTFVSPIPESGTIISATLSLHATDGAVLTELLQVNGAPVTRTNNYTYTITGNQIQFDYNPPCPPNALCVGPPRGTIGGDEVSLNMYGVTSGVVYNFRFFFAPD